MKQVHPRLWVGNEADCASHPEKFARSPRLQAPLLHQKHGVYPAWRRAPAVSGGVEAGKPVDRHWFNKGEAVRVRRGPLTGGAEASAKVTLYG
jgi:hypothetical protein